MSQELQWLCIRDSSAFLRKKAGDLRRRGPKARAIFSAEPGSLTGLHGACASPLLGASSVAVQTTGKKETIVLSSRTKGAKGLRKPAKAVVKTGISKCPAKARKAVAASVDKAYNRRDLMSKVEAKCAALRKSMKTKKAARHVSRPKKA